MTCRAVTDFILDYLSGSLPAEVLDEFERHLRACRACREYLALYQSTVKAGHVACENDDAPAAAAGVPHELVAAILAARRGS